MYFSMLFFCHPPLVKSGEEEMFLQEASPMWHLDCVYITVVISSNVVERSRSWGLFIHVLLQLISLGLNKREEVKNLGQIFTFFKIYLLTNLNNLFYIQWRQAKALVNNHKKKNQSWDHMGWVCAINDVRWHWTQDIRL